MRNQANKINTKKTCYWINIIIKITKKLYRLWAAKKIAKYFVIVLTHRLTNLRNYVIYINLPWMFCVRHISLNKKKTLIRDYRITRCFLYVNAIDPIDYTWRAKALINIKEVITNTSIYENFSTKFHIKVQTHYWFFFLYLHF